MMIRKGTREDLPHILRLIKELAAYEKAPDEVTVTLSDLEQDGFGERPLFDFLVADTGTTIAGMALYFFSYSTWKGKCMYLEDIVVSEAFRQQGIGTNLFRALIEEARLFGAERLQWQVLDWNEPAIAFYRKMNAHLDGSWISCKLTKDQMAGLTLRKDPERLYED